MVKLTIKNVLYILMYAIPNVFFSIAILYLINNVLSGKISFNGGGIALAFFIYVIYSYLLNLFFQQAIIRISVSMVYHNEVQIFEQLNKMSLPKFNKLGAEKVYNILEDLRLFVFLPGVIVSTVNSVLMVLICIGYLFFISVMVSIIVVTLMLLVIAIYMGVNRKLARKAGQLREYNDFYYKCANDAIMGFKQLKVYSAKGKRLIENYLRPNRGAARALDMELSNAYMSINILGQYGLYVIIGTILLVLSSGNILNQQSGLSFVIILLFISGPLNNLISMQGFYVKAFVANRRIKDFFRNFAEVVHLKEVKPVQTDFVSLCFENVSFSYDKDIRNKEFALKNINLTFKKGEVVFIVGGNGSGKSTFINILTGLYQPSAGRILLNGKPVNNTDDCYKKNFSVIFTENYLFSNNYEGYTLTDNAAYRSLLDKMALGAIVPDNEYIFSEALYSKGQTKRIAMVFALLENRPVLILDEWAADQDPQFRKYFYTKLIPDLKMKGITIVAVTHDDAYFNIADRVIMLDYGHILDEYSQQHTDMKMENFSHRKNGI